MAVSEDTVLPSEAERSWGKEEITLGRGEVWKVLGYNSKVLPEVLM